MRPAVRLAQQRQERLRGCDQAEHVGVERRRARCPATARTRLALASSTQDAGVVDQDVELAVAAVRSPRAAAAMLAASVTSSAMASTGRPSACSFSAASTALSRSRPASRVCTPASASWRTVSRPMPRVAPVTSAILSCCMDRGDSMACAWRDCAVWRIRRRRSGCAIGAVRAARCARPAGGRPACAARRRTPASGTGRTGSRRACRRTR